MSSQATKSILILDDDAYFRQLVSGLLQTRGYHVVEARSAKEASASFANGDPGLAIVDYRLPESDGITWITALRESGRNFPIVFVSGTWCDEKTFNWLRNILKVSLILRKPIVAELFVQQLENILPPPPMPLLKRERELASGESGAAPFVEASSPSDQISDHIARLTEAIDKSAPDSPLLNQLVEMRSKLMIQQKLNSAKQEYGSILRDDWTALSQAVSVAQREPENRIALDDAIQRAHRIRGTAGSMGYGHIGDCAGKIEDFLRGFDPTDTLVEVLWTEIFRAIADGELSVREITGISFSATETKSFHSSILLFGNASTFLLDHIEELANAGIEGVVCDSVASALGRAKRRQFDGAIFDLGAEPPARVFDLASQVRAAHSGPPMPLGFVSAGQDAPDEASLAYAGSSVFLWSPVRPSDLKNSVGAILSCGNAQKPRILTVDDDPVLTSFIQSILVAEDMIVETLNQPIQILTKVEEFQPDLMLLDVMMPGLSGYDVCRMLRATEKWNHLPILFLTSKSDAEGRAAAFAAGGNDFLSKPVLAPEVVARVRAQLDQVGYQAGSSKGDTDGMMNRKEFLIAARAMLERTIADGGEMALCLISIDDMINLSIVQTLYGAEQAETALGELIRTHFRAESLRGKWGDGGYSLAVPWESKLTITEAAAKLLDEFCSLKFSSAATGTFKASFSAGLAGVPGDEATIEALLNTANQRMVAGRKEKPGVIASL